MKTILFPLIILVAFGCGEKKTKEDSSAPNPESTYQPFKNFNDTTSKPERSFYPVLKRDVEKIAQGVKKGKALCNCYQTSSADFSNVNAIACQVVGGQVAVGVWAMGGNAGIYSVGLPTATISDWGQHPDVKLEDDGFQEVLEFVRDQPSCK